MSLEEFFPVYPEISDDKFEEKLFKKMELLELIPDEKKAKRGDVLLPNNLYLHQELTKRYLEPFTGYEAVLLDHEVGVGKTRSVIGTCENYLDNYKANRVYFFSKNDKVKNNFMNEIQNMKLSKYFQKNEAEYARMTYKGFKISRTRAIEGKSYTFQTFEIFATDDLIIKLEEIQIKISEMLRIGFVEEQEELSYNDKLRLQEIKNKLDAFIDDETTLEDALTYLDEEEQEFYKSIQNKQKKRVQIDEQKAEELLSDEERKHLNHVRNIYRNSVIAIDEVHNIGVTSFNPYEKKDMDDSHKQYRRFWSLLKTVKDCHIILLSATPMVDSAVKMASIMNLILPRNKQIDYKELDNVIETYDEEKIRNFLCPYMKGRISFLRQSSGVAKQNFMGIEYDFGGNVKSKIVIDAMEPSQALAYKELVKKRTTEFHHDLRQVSNFAIVDLQLDLKKSSKRSFEKFDDEDFIDVNLDKEQFDVDVEDTKTDQKFRYINQSDFVRLLDDKRTHFIEDKYTKFYGNLKEMNNFETFTNISSLKESQQVFFLQQFFKNVTTKNYKELIPKLKNEEKMFKKLNDYTLLKSVMRPDLAVKNIKKSGIKIANVITDILENLTKPREQQRCVFIYSHYKVYGAIIIAIMLNILGFQKLIPSDAFMGAGSKCSLKDKNNPFRFATITDSKDRIEQIVKEFNNPNNAYGEYLKVVIGSPQSSESISFFNVRSIHILEPGWNDQDTIQAIGRGVRSNSHQAFPPDQRFVDIHIHVGVIENRKGIDNKVIDMKATRFSAEKAYKINLVQKVARDCSYDKEFNAWRNGLPQKQIDEIDFSTYRIYYRDEFVRFLFKKIQPLFFKKSYYTLEELSNETGFTKYDFISALDQIKQYMLQNQYGIPCYPHYDGKYMFLLPYRVAQSEFLSYYSQVLDIKMDNNTVSFIKNNQLDDVYLQHYIEKLNKEKPKKVIPYLRRYNSSKEKVVPFGIEIYLLEYILKKDVKERTVNEKIFLDYLQWRWFVVEHDKKVKVVHTLQFISETQHFNCVKRHFKPDGKLRVLDENGWRFATQEEEKQILTPINERLEDHYKKFEKANYFGIVCTTDGVLRFVNLLEEKNEQTPKECPKTTKDSRKNRRGVSIDSIGIRCSIFTLFQMWEDIIELMEEYNKIPFTDYDEFEKEFRKEFSDEENLAENIAKIFEEFFTKKDLIWIY